MTESPQGQVLHKEPGHDAADLHTSRSEWIRAASQMALSGGLPTLPGYIFELNRLLSSRQVDLKRVSAIIRTDPILTANVIRMCNPPWSDTRTEVHSIEEAVLLVGREQLRTLVLTCTLTQQADGAMGSEDLHFFWQHSFLAAVLSERLAQVLGFPAPERAYLAGLLHDVGLLALLAAHARNSHTSPRQFALSLTQLLNQELEGHGGTHCEVGRAIAVAWELPADLVEVFERHHDPATAVHDPLLVGIVAAADQLCCLRGVVPGSRPRLTALDASAYDRVFATCLPQLNPAQRGPLAEAMEIELQRVAPMLEFDRSGILGSSRPHSAGVECSPLVSSV